MSSSIKGDVSDHRRTRRLFIRGGREVSNNQRRRCLSPSKETSPSIREVDDSVHQRRRCLCPSKETSLSIMSSLSRTLSVLIESISVHNKTKNDFGLWTTWTIALKHPIIIIIMRGRTRHQNHWGKADLKPPKPKRSGYLSEATEETNRTISPKFKDRWN